MDISHRKKGEGTSEFPQCKAQRKRCSQLEEFSWCGVVVQSHPRAKDLWEQNKQTCGRHLDSLGFIDFHDCFSTFCDVQSVFMSRRQLTQMLLHKRSLRGANVLLSWHESKQPLHSRKTECRETGMKSSSLVYDPEMHPSMRGWAGEALLESFIPVRPLRLLAC